MIQKNAAVHCKLQQAAAFLFLFDIPFLKADDADNRCGSQKAHGDCDAAYGGRTGEPGGYGTHICVYEVVRQCGGYVEQLFEKHLPEHDKK